MPRLNLQFEHLTPILKLILPVVTDLKALSPLPSLWVTGIFLALGILGFDTHLGRRTAIRYSQSVPVSEWGIFRKFRLVVDATLPSTRGQTTLTKQRKQRHLCHCCLQEQEESKAVSIGACLWHSVPQSFFHSHTFNQKQNCGMKPHISRVSDVATATSKN